MSEVSGLTTEQQIYADLIDEARIRLNALDDMIDRRESWVPRLLQEFVHLQLRMLCETIALGCLVAHGDVKDRALLKSWSAAEIMKRLEALDPDCYPRGVRFSVINDKQFTFSDNPAPQLSKADLVKIWGQSGNFLHRGSARNLIAESGKILNVDLVSVIEAGRKIRNLLDQHVIASADKKRALFVYLSKDERATVFVGKAP